MYVNAWSPLGPVCDRDSGPTLNMPPFLFALNSIIILMHCSSWQTSEPAPQPLFGSPIEQLGVGVDRQSSSVQIMSELS